MLNLLFRHYSGHYSIVKNRETCCTAAVRVALLFIRYTVAGGGRELVGGSGGGIQVGKIDFPPQQILRACWH